MAAPSNGEMGRMWFDRWCYRCVHDHAFSHGPELGDGADGCEIQLRMTCGQDTPEVVEENDYQDPNYRGWDPDKLVCRMFERCPCQDDPDWDPPVKPSPDPNQTLLFEVIDESPGIPMVVVPIETPVEATA